MTNLEFFEVIKKNMKEYFVSKGYTKCRIYKGRRNAICFEKEVEFYTVYIEFHWQDYFKEADVYDFCIGFTTTFLLYDTTKPRWLVWSFKTEEDLLELLKIIPQKIEEQDFFKKVDEASYKYFHRKDVLDTPHIASDNLGKNSVIM